MTSFYFLDESIRGKSKDKNMLRESSDFPVRIRKNAWEHFDEPRRISRIFSFDDPGQQSYFVSEIMRSIDLSHGIRITIEKSNVIIETRTEDFEDVTELDLEIAHDCDQIYNDSLFILEPA